MLLKTKFLLTLFILLVLSTNSFALFGGSGSIFNKPLGTGKGSVGNAIKKNKILPPPPKDSILAKPLGTGEGSVSKTAENAKKIVDTGIHDSGKVLGDGVKGLRNAIAQMQGLNVEKTKKELKELTSQCRQDNHNLNLVNQDLEELNSFAIRQIEISGSNTQEYYEKVDKKVRSLNHLTNNAGTLARIGGLSWTLGVAGKGSLAKMATWGGAYSMAAAAVVIAMNESVRREIEIEEDKLNKCAKEFNNTFIQYESLYAKSLELLNKNKQQNDSELKLTKAMNKLKSHYTACVLELKECPGEVKFKESKSELEKSILTHSDKYGETQRTKDLLINLKSMEL